MKLGKLSMLLLACLLPAGFLAGCLMPPWEERSWQLQDAVDDLDGDGFSVDDGDCDDGDPAINPGETEIPYDGHDNDCNPSTLDDDLDGDGYSNASDCDDSNPLVFPGNNEICDFLDNNCDGVVDNGNFPDADADGLPDCRDDDADGDGFTEEDGDCDDLDPLFNPDATEACDGYDTDCNGVLPSDEEDDGDSDGVVDCRDCDDNDPSSTILADDPDCDGLFEDMTTQGLYLVLLPGGTFDMGCTAGQSSCGGDQNPAHSVTLTNDFWLGETELTNEQGNAFFSGNPWNWGLCGTDCPLAQAHWYQALALANAFSTAEGLSECYTLSGCTGPPGAPLGGMDCSASVNSPTGSVYDCVGYRLPTEAEWEYAARAGTDLLYAGSNTFSTVGWSGEPGSPNGALHPVAQLAPNDWGLYDMSGNVWEWVWDWYDSDYYSISPGTDPEGPSTGQSRGRRGGGWKLSSGRVIARSSSQPHFSYGDIGLRLARTVP